MRALRPFGAANTCGSPAGADHLPKSCCSCSNIAIGISHKKTTPTRASCASLLLDLQDLYGSITASVCEAVRAG
jgi:hypothetical protein